MNVVVTGAASSIGAVTVRQLLEQGHQVAAVVRPGSANLCQLTDPLEGKADLLERLQIVPLDLGQIRRIGDVIGETTDAAAAIAVGEPLPVADLHRLAAAGDPFPRAALRSHFAPADAWIHIGWDGAGSHNRTLRSVQQENVRHSLEAVKAAAGLGCRRFLFTGSQAEYGVHHETITEDTPCRPVSEYGIAKVEFGRQAEALCRKLGMEYVHTRIFSVYGPGDHPWSLVQTCLSTWMDGGEMKLGECTQFWNFLYIEDTAAALVCLLTEGRPGVYNIAGNDTRPLRAYIEEMYRLCGSRGSFRYGERPQNAEGPADLMPDISRICRETAWRPVTAFSEGIYETLHRLRA